MEMSRDAAPSQIHVALPARLRQLPSNRLAETRLRSPGEIIASTAAIGLPIK
jgi:hypothetical protein